MEISNQKIYDLLKCVQESNDRIREDIKDIKKDFQTHKEEISKIQDTVKTLENHNEVISEKINLHDIILRKKNIVLFGLPESTTLEEDLKSFFLEKLSIKIANFDLDNFYRIGVESENKVRAVLVKFTREKTKQDVFKNVKKLKGTRYSIANDLSPKQRQEQKILYHHYKTAKSKQYNAKIVKNTLIVDGTTYSVQDLQEDEELNFAEFTEEKLFPNHSAPPTPNQQNPESNLNDSSEEETLIEKPEISKPNKPTTNTLGTPRISRSRINSLKNGGNKNEDKKKPIHKKPRQ